MIFIIAAIFGGIMGLGVTHSIIKKNYFHLSLFILAWVLFIIRISL